MPLSLFKRLFITTLALSLFFVLGVASASAAGSLTVTNQAPAMTVGVNIPNFSVSIAVTPETNFVNDNTLTLTVPGNFPKVIMGDANDSKLGVSSITIGGHTVCIAAGVTCVADGSTRTLTITFANVLNMDGVNPLSDNDIIVINFTTAADTAGLAAPGNVTTWSIAEGDFGGTRAGGSVNVSGITPITIAAASQAASINVSNITTVATNGTVALTFTAPVTLDAGTKINITLPANYSIPPALEETLNITDSGFDTAVAFTVPAVTGVTGQVLTLVTANAGINAGDEGTVTIPSPGINAIYAAAQSTITVQVTTAGDVVISTTSSPTITATTAADANASIDATNIATVGTAGTIALTVTVPVQLEVGDKIQVTFPANYNIAGVSTGVGAATSTFAAQHPTFTASQSGQVLTLTATALDNMAAGSGTITIPTGIIALYQAGASSALVTSVIDITPDPTDANMAYEANGTISATVAAVDTTAAIGFVSNNVVGTTGVTTITLTTPFALDPGDTIDITFPAFVDITGDAETATGTFDNSDAATIICDDASQVLTCTVSAANTLTTGTIILQNITTSYVDSTDITVFEVEDEGAPANDIVIESTVTLTNSLVGDLTSTNVEPLSLVVGTLGTFTVNFTSTAPIPASGKIKITFPSGYDLNSFGTQTPGSASGITASNWSAAASGQVVTLTNSSGITAAGAISFTLANIRNPASTGSTGAYTILTEISSGPDIETDGTVATDSILGAASSSVTVNVPTGLAIADAANGNGVVITWTDPTNDDSTHMQILKGVDPLPVDGTVFATVAAGVETFTDTDVEDGDTVTYQIRSYGSGHTSALTSEVSFVVGSTVSDTTGGTDDGTTDDGTNDGTSDGTTDDGTADDGSSDTATGGTSFSDTNGHWAEDEITAMSDAGVIEGNPDGTFDPDGNLNRAQAAAMLWRIWMSDTILEVEEAPFSDVAVGEWYAPYIFGLKSFELVNGNPDGTYQPAEEMNRAEFLQLAMNVYLSKFVMQEEYAVMAAEGMTDRYADLDLTQWYAEVVSVATEWGFVQGSACTAGTCFNAGATITRAEAAKILYNMFESVL